MRKVLFSSALCACLVTAMISLWIVANPVKVAAPLSTVPTDQSAPANGLARAVTHMTRMVISMVIANVPPVEPRWLAKPVITIRRTIHPSSIRARGGNRRVTCNSDSFRNRSEWRPLNCMVCSPPADTPRNQGAF
jgi:hypothetical protein